MCAQILIKDINKMTEINNKALSVGQALETLGLGRTKIYELIKSGELPARKVGSRTLILQSDMEDFLQNLSAYPVSANAEGVKHV